MRDLPDGIHDAKHHSYRLLGDEEQRQSEDASRSYE